MKKLNRRTFLTLAGTSTAAAATGVAVTSASLLTGHTGEKGGTLTFRAVAGLPSKLLPAYASYVIEGHVNLATRSGAVTKTFFAGDPTQMSRIAIPSQSRVIRVTDAEDLGDTFRITGVIDDRSQLQRGESPTFNILIDPAHRIAKTTFYGSELVMNLEA